MIVPIPPLELSTESRYKGRLPRRRSRLNVEHAIVAIGANRIRQNLVRRLDGLIRWATIVHPLAYLAEGVEVGEGTYVAAGALVLPARPWADM